jgi:molybdopterin converting factor subunit 1
MKCQVLLFAQLRDGIGRDCLMIELPNGATVADALESLAETHPPIAAIRHHIAVAIDEAYRPNSFKLHDGCTIALIPPVSGG